MNKSLDILPISLFFITYYFYGFFHATTILMLSTAVLLITSYIKNPQPLRKYASQLLIVVFGSLTLITKDPVFLVWKPTIMYSITACSLLFSQRIFRKSLVEKGFNMMQLHIPDYPWHRLDYTLSTFFLLLAVLNIQVFQYFGLDIWVKYKFYSLFGLMLVLFPIIIHVESKSIKHENTESISN
jgi:intracellular septation protein